MSRHVLTECYRAPRWTKQAERLISALRGRTKIPRRQMSTQLNTAKNKPSPLKFQAAPSPQAKSEELSTFLKVVLGMFPVTAYGLALWQWQRRKWKLNLLKTIEERTAAEPVPLTELMGKVDFSDLDYTKVWLEGEFDHSREILIGYRPNFQPDLTSKGFKANFGLWVVTPLKLKDTGREVLVNRGWVPVAWENPEIRKEGQITGNIKIYGMIRTKERRNPLDVNPTQDPKNPRLFSNRDIVAMSQYLGTDPVYIDSDLESSVEGGPIGGQTNIKFNNRHMEYVLTWLSLAIGMSILWKNRAFPKTVSKRYTRKTVT
ncbi:surfeit locus protein 1-like isoform X2 [Crassostrea virginica]